MTFHVGQKVVCVKESAAWQLNYGEHGPKRGTIYTVRDVADYGSGPGLRLAEIVNEPRMYVECFAECTFCVSQFRPIVERKTDISIFQKILTDIPETVE